MSLNLYSNGTIFLPYNAKRLLNDSLSRTTDGYELYYNATTITDTLTGIANILLARLESALAFSLFAFFSIPMMMLSSIMSAILLPLAGVFNLLSRLPLISSFESVQLFTKDSSEAIYRTLRINCIGIPAAFLFLSSSAINSLPIPGVTKIANQLINWMNALVAFLGPMVTVRVVVPGVENLEGTKEKLGFFADAEECIRSVSTENYLEQEIADNVEYHYEIVEYVSYPQ